MAKINWTPQADNDIDNIIQFLAPQSQSYAKIQVQRIFDKTKMIANMPNIGRVVPELEYEKVREIIVGPYRVVYHILSEERIDIITVHHSAVPLDIKNL